MKISVILPTYNRAKLLKTSLESLIKMHPYEIIVINDNSTDDTEKILNEISVSLNKETNLVTINNKERIGCSRSRNKGIKGVKGDLVFFSDDDHLYPNSELLKKAESIFATNLDVGAIVLNEERLHSVRTKISLRYRLLMFLIEWIIIESYLRKQGYVKYGLGAMIIRRTIINNVKYDEGYLGNCWREENQLQLDIQRLGWKLYFDPELRFYHILADYGGMRSLSEKEYHYWSLRNHVRFLKKNFPLKLIFLFLILSTRALQYKIQKKEGKIFLRAFIDGLKSERV